ncbi:NAD(P)-dependent oxidoreductase [Tsukamurella soli]|uniref:NAD(P)-dependent oxidoreductase n=2 Tax=Tsukamurella soli TaxID=644556 RepID=A0ABP8K960_9ACTN
MVERIAGAGHVVHVHPRTREQAERLHGLGAVAHESLAAVGQASEAVFSIVPGPQEVHEVWCGTNGLLTGMRPGSIGIEMSTTGPESVEDVAAQADLRGIALVDAPVSGGVTGAARGTLAMFAGGADAAVTSAQDVLEVLGTVYRTGAVGSGQVMKLVNQALVGANTYGLCLGWALAARHGLDLQQTFRALTGGAADGRLLRLEWPWLLEDDHTSGFAASHMAKDLRLLSRFCADARLDPHIVDEICTAFATVASTHPTLTATQALGSALARSDTTPAGVRPQTSDAAPTEGSFS